MASSSTAIPSTLASPGSSSQSSPPAYNTRSSKASNGKNSKPSKSRLPRSSSRYASPSSTTTAYLLLYNSVSAVAWAVILAYTAAHIWSFLPVLLGWRQQQPGYDAGKEAPHDQGKEYDDVLERENESRIRSVGDEGSLREGSLYAAIGALTRWTQTAALAEVGHAVLGLVRASPFTTAIQVTSRLFLVWAIVYPFPALTSPHVSKAYPTMLLAWSITEVVRYTYFAVLLNKNRLLDNKARVDGAMMGTFSVNNDAAAAAVSNEQPPPWLVWLRYNLFFVLYPLGILSEMRLVYLAAEPATEKVGDERVGWLLWAILAVYIPGSYVMITHMITQRRRVKRGKAKSRTV